MQPNLLHLPQKKKVSAVAATQQLNEQMQNRSDSDSPTPRQSAPPRFWANVRVGVGVSDGASGR